VGQFGFAGLADRMVNEMILLHLPEIEHAMDLFLRAPPYVTNTAIRHKRTVNRGWRPPKPPRDDLCPHKRPHTGVAIPEVKTVPRNVRRGAP
jgi:hypothetical protein